MEGDNSGIAASDSAPSWQQNSSGILEGPSCWAPDERYYFSDGNIVILAETTLFRVHRSVLAMYSEVFKDMFTLPQPATGTKIDGFPLVRLPDTKDQVGGMLETIYEGGTW